MKIGVGAVAAVAAIAIAAYFAMSGGNDSKGGTATGSTSSSSTHASSSSPASAGTPVSYSSVAIYDGNDRSEGQSGLVNGQIGSHGWSTHQYCQPYATYDNGKTKVGTGLIFDLGGAKQISAANVTVKTGGATVEMWVADSSVTSPPDINPGQPPLGFTKIATQTSDDTAVVLKADKAVTSQYVLIWFTKPLPARGHAGHHLQVRQGQRPAVRRHHLGRHLRVLTPAMAGAAALGDLDDAAVLARHVAGDRDAFGELFRRHRDRLWAVAVRTLGDPEEAADALQDAMVSAYRAAGSFRGDAAVTTWLHRVVVNGCSRR